MRIELILVLLGIVCISTLSSFVSVFVNLEVDKVLLDTVVGVVGAGNFSYWQLGHEGSLLVELTSLTGDADLYVSDNLRPSYEVDKNNFSSATCGSDMVDIPPDFPRPIGIGVFGHWSSSQSEYSIQVFLDKAAMDDNLLNYDNQAQKNDDWSGIGVFGHWSSSQSEYSIQVFLDKAAMDDNLLNYDNQAQKNDDWSDTDKKRSRDKPSKGSEDETKPRFLKLLNILDVLFEMFIL